MVNYPVKNSLRIAAIVLLVAVALNALAAGYSFITDPSGKEIGISTDYLRPSAPFSDYLIPGIVLFVVNGVLSLIVAVWATWELKAYPWLVMAQGCILVGWIGIQLMMVTASHPLHLFIAAIGFLLFLFGWLIHQK